MSVAISHQPAGRRVAGHHQPGAARHLGRAAGVDERAVRRQVVGHDRLVPARAHEVQGAGDHEDRPDERAEGSHGARDSRALVSRGALLPRGGARRRRARHAAVHPRLPGVRAHVGACSSSARRRPAGTRWRPTCRATATRRPTRRTPGSGWSTPSSASTPSAPAAPSRCASTTGAGSSACAGPASTPSTCARSSSARPASSPTASGTAWPRRCAPRARASRSSTARRARPSARCSPRSRRASPSRRCDEYFKAYADPVRRRGQLELYRSGDFAELERYRGRLAALGVPTLLLFGSEDPFARVATRASPGAGDPARAHGDPRRHRALHVRRGARPRRGDRRGLPARARLIREVRTWRRPGYGGPATLVPTRRGHMRGTRRSAWAAAAVCAFIGVIAPAAGAQKGATPPTLDWQPCGTAANVTCATATVPLDYDKPQGQTIKLHLAKSPAIDQAHKIGSLFINFGGPGGTAADRFEARGADLPARPQPALRHHRHGPARRRPELAGDRLQGQPGDRRHLLAAVHDAGQPRRQRADRQGPALHQALHRRSTTASWRTSRRPTSRATSTCCASRWASRRSRTSATRTAPSWAPRTRACSRRNYRAMVLDGPVDANAYINDPMRDLSAQTQRVRARARALLAGVRGRPGRVPRLGGGSDPWDAYDALIEQVNANPTAGRRATRSTVTTSRTGTAAALYSKANWPVLAQALADAAERRRLAA